MNISSQMLVITIIRGRLFFIFLFGVLCADLLSKRKFKWLSEKLTRKIFGCLKALYKLSMDNRWSLVPAHSTPQIVDRDEDPHRPMSYSYAVGRKFWLQHSQQVIDIIKLHLPDIYNRQELDGVHVSDLGLVGDFWFGEGMAVRFSKFAQNARDDQHRHYDDNEELMKVGEWNQEVASSDMKNSHIRHLAMESLECWRILRLGSFLPVKPL